VLVEWTTPTLPDPVRLSLRHGAITVSLGMEQVYSFDGEGRLLTAFRDSRLYKRGFDGRVLAKWRPWKSGRPKHIRHDLAGDEKQRLLSEIRDTIEQVLASLPVTAPPESRERLEQVIAWDAAAYTLDRRRFQAVYKPVPILPPDQYLTLVLQATEGCHYNECSFCRFYRQQPFHIKSDQEFRMHVQAVKNFLGAGIRLRRTIFLADANALVIPHPRLLYIFDALSEAFEIAPAELIGATLAHWKTAHPLGITGVYSFIDAVTGNRKPREQFAELAELGLRRVYIGMESGHVPLLQFLRKPSMPGDVRHVVNEAKAAGVHIGVIVMLAIGGNRYAVGHVADTVEVINSLGLDHGDILYFSEFVDEPGSDYAAQAQAEEIRALTDAEVRAQASAIRSGLRFAQPPKIAVYDIREFIY
jgi:radical SAM superfamily enzyme YgiQ (UPF0313 family)